MAFDLEFSMKPKKIALIIVPILVFVFICFTACGKEERNFGVFLGADEINVSVMSKYKLVVIDAEIIPKSQIAELQDKGTLVYSYLNVGTVETFRDYYNYFLDLGLLMDIYEDWPDERFVDVSDERWQNYVVDTLAAGLAQKNVDGLFLDNFDVYYYYDEQPEFLNGLIIILQGLKENYHLPIMINGGDVAVTEILETNPELIDSVNQECVFTGIDFEKVKFTIQDAETSEYYQDYLAACKSKGLDIYILEYGKKVPKRTIKDYCEQNGYNYYVSKDLDLTRAQY